MWQTVFTIPHEAAGIPLFGFGWVLAALLLATAVLLLVAWRWPPARTEVKGLLPVLGVVALAVIWVLPFLELRGLDGEPLGLPIRGYGLMMLAGVICGVGLTLHRAPSMGVTHDQVFALTFWMFVCGISGARLFFVIQYWSSVHQPGSSPWASLAQALKFNEGGLVVYGAVIGGLAAALVFCRRHRLNIWTVGDLVAPGMVLGLALGRIGCLFNGCCHGGPCSDEAFAVTFPRGTHPYMEQLESGQLMGWELEGSAPDIRIRTVRPDSPAEQRGVQPGDRLVRTPGANDLLLAGKSGDPDRQLLAVEKPGGTIVTWTAQQLPPRSLPTRPAQIYSSINALLLCLLLIAWHPYRRHHGELFVLMLTIYPITRFMLELVRTDEPGRWGTALTISQWISIGLLCFSAVMWFLIWRHPRTAAGQASGA